MNYESGKARARRARAGLGRERASFNRKGARGLAARGYFSCRPSEQAGRGAARLGERAGERNRLAVAATKSWKGWKSRAAAAAFCALPRDLLHD